MERSINPSSLRMLKYKYMNILNVPQRSYRNYGINAIRFFLALFVVFVHIVPWYASLNLDVNYYYLIINKIIIKIFQPLCETNPAVLGFITLSGYCIHRNGLRVFNFNPYTLKDILLGYFIRRFFRIIPLFLIGSLLGVIVFLQFGNDVKVQSITGTKVITSYGLVFKLFGLHSFAPIYCNESYQGNAPLITVAVEFWLYVFYPLGLWFCKKYDEQKFTIFLITITLLGAITYSFFPSTVNWWHNGSLYGYLIYWWIGVFSTDSHFIKRISKYNYHIIALYILLTFFLTLGFKISVISEIRKVLLCVLFGQLIAAIDFNQSAVKEERNFIIFHARKIFECSYSIYALHTPIIVFCICYKIDFYMAFLLTIILGYVSFLSIERPFITYSKFLKNSLLQRVLYQKR